MWTWVQEVACWVRWARVNGDAWMPVEVVRESGC